MSTVVAIVAAVWISVHPSSASPKKDKATSPHWKPAACGECHKDTQKPTTIGIAAAERRCLECHDGRHAPREVHPVGRTFAGEQVKLPEGWPTLDGKLACLTCHDALMGCDREAKRPADNAAFLREYHSDRPLEFCAKCHESAAKAEGRYSPHLMLDEEGKAADGACLFCHDKAFKFDGSMLRTGEPRLRADEVTLCASCHREHKDWFGPGHIGHAATKKVLSNMLKADDEAGFSPESATQPADRAPRCLPLSLDKRIVCSTCHNPHQQGVFAEDSAMARGAIVTAKKDKEQRLGLRGFGKDVCHVCHRK